MQFRLPKTSSLFVAFGLLCNSGILMAQNPVKPCISQKNGAFISASITKVTANKPLLNENVASGSSTIDRQPSFTVVLSEPIGNFCSVAIYDDKTKKLLSGMWTNTSLISKSFRPTEPLTIGSQVLKVALKTYDSEDLVYQNKLAWNVNVADSQTISIADTPTSEYERDRLLVTYLLPDFSPTGLEAAAGSRLVVYLNTAANSQNLTAKFRIGTPGIGEDNDIQIENLKSGVNFINVKISGLIYISYTKSTPPFGAQKADFTFAQGFNRVPYYRLGSTTNEDWKKQLKVFPNARNVVLESDKAMLVYLRETAVKHQDDNQELVLKTYDSIIQIEDNLMGLDNSYPDGATNKTKDLNRSRLNKFLIVQTRRGPPNSLFAGNDYVGVHYELDGKNDEDSEIKMFTSAIKNRPWGAAHEIGHQNQQKWMKWIGIGGEITVNIYASAVKRALLADARIDKANLEKIKQYLSNTNEKNFSKLDDFDGLYMYHQLWLAYGDDFYIKFHKLARQNPLDDYLSSYKNIQFFILNASVISGDDLAGFFSKWGWDADADTVRQINNKGLPKPKKDPSTFFN